MHLKRATKREAVLPLVNHVTARLRDEPYIREVMVCGGFRRNLPVVEDADVVVVGAQRTVYRVVESLGLPCRFYYKGPGHCLAEISDFGFTFYTATPDNFGAMILAYTGPPMFNILVRGRAKKEGYRLNQFGLFANDTLIAGRTERQIFEALGLVYVPPDGREIHGRGVRNRATRCVLLKKDVGPGPPEKTR